MEPTKRGAGGHSHLQFCSNCTRLVNNFNSTPLTGQLNFQETSKETDADAGSCTQAQINSMEGSTILEAVSLVCGLNKSVEVGQICDRCQSGIHAMLTAFLTFTQCSTKHSTELFRSLKARSEPLIQKIQDRWSLNEQLTAALAAVTRDEQEVMEPPVVVITPDQLKAKALARAKRRKYSGARNRNRRKYPISRLQNLMGYNGPRVKKPQPLPLVPPVPDLAPVATPSSTREQVTESDAGDDTPAYSLESNNLQPVNNDQSYPEDESCDPLVQVKMECRSDEDDDGESGAEMNQMENDYSDELFQTPTFALSHAIKQQRESDSDKDYDEYEPQHRPLRPIKKSRRVIVKHPLPEELVTKRAPTKRYTCLQSDCGKQFVFPRKFADHMMTVHDMPTPHICKFCDSVFLQKPHLTEHLKSHQGESGLFTCQAPKCTAVFPYKANLKAHMTAVHSEPGFQCEECGKAFRQSQNLKKHVVLIHSKEELERPFICEECGRGFVFEEYLRNHMKSHNTDRPYTCTLCDKTFKNTKGLKSHQVAHKDDKPFTCQTCARTFKTSSTLRTHQLSHANRREFGCSFPGCARTFNRKVHLIQHFLAIHKIHKAEADQLAKNPIRRQQDKDITSSSVQTAINLSCTRGPSFQLNSARESGTTAEMNAAIQNIPELAGFNTHYFTPW